MHRRTVTYDKPIIFECTDILNIILEYLSLYDILLLEETYKSMRIYLRQYPFYGRYFNLKNYDITVLYTHQFKSIDYRGLFIPIDILIRLCECYQLNLYSSYSFNKKILKILNRYTHFHEIILSPLKLNRICIAIDIHLEKYPIYFYDKPNNVPIIRQEIIYKNLINCISTLDGRPLLSYYIKQGLKISSLNFLIQGGMNIHRVDKKFRNVLRYVVKYQPTNHEMFKLLVEKNVTPSSRLYLTATKQCSLIILKLLDYYRVPMNNKKSTLIKAIKLGWLEGAEWLLQHGVNVDAQDKHCLTALHYAIMQNHRQAIQLLLRYGVNTKSIDKKGDNLLYFYINHCKKEVHCLENLEYYRKLSNTTYLITNHHGETPLTLCILYNFPLDVIKYLLTQCPFQSTYIELALEFYQDREVIMFLLGYIPKKTWVSFTDIAYEHQCDVFLNILD